MIKRKGFVLLAVLLIASFAALLLVHMQQNLRLATMVERHSSAYAQVTRVCRDVLEQEIHRSVFPRKFTRNIHGVAIQIESRELTSQKITPCYQYSLQCRQGNTVVSMTAVIDVTLHRRLSWIRS